MPYRIPPEELDDKLPAGWLAVPLHTIRRPRTVRKKLKVKNCCAQCGKQWTSMRGLVEFQLGYSLGRVTRYLACQVYQQKCRRCDIYSLPDYYEVEFSDLVMAVAVRFDNPQALPFVRKKNGNPRSINLDCEACQLGIDH